MEPCWHRPRLSYMVWRTDELHLYALPFRRFHFRVESLSCRRGGLIYANLGNGPDGFNHAMVVVGNTSGANSVPVICQKSRNQHDMLFSESVRRAPANTSWAGLQWKAD